MWYAWVELSWRLFFLTRLPFLSSTSRVDTNERGEGGGIYRAPRVYVLVPKQRAGYPKFTELLQTRY